MTIAVDRFMSHPPEKKRGGSGAGVEPPSEDLAWNDEALGPGAQLLLLLRIPFEIVGGMPPPCSR